MRKDNRPADLSDIEEVRQAIDMADEMLLQTLSQRLRAVTMIAKIKRAYKKSILDEKREEEIKRTWKIRAKKLGIREEFALLILDLILHESKNVQSE